MSEPISIPDNNTSDFTEMGSDFIKKIHFKIGLILFIAYVLINSDLFIDTFLQEDMKNGDKPNTKGTVIQGIILVISYIIIDIMNQTGNI